ncbi:hypothetical protein [Methylomonas sp. EFPC1]|uniref:hypothetical protein n=1 Tax=Methylomonas sp. EFPC1 TaxID=2812647 RepID=UPI0031F80CCA
MSKPITSSKKFGESEEFTSFDKIASKLQEKWPDVFKGPNEENGITKRSLAAKISELDRGKSTWWRKREAETDCLVELLGLDRDELGLDQKTGRHIFALSALPDCPPLDLMREDGWDIAKAVLLSEDYPQNEPVASALYTKPTLDAWLSSQGSLYPSKKVESLYVPDETEYQLLTRTLAPISRLVLGIKSCSGFATRWPCHRRLTCIMPTSILRLP